MISVAGIRFRFRSAGLGAFSLVELLVVVGIMGILAGTAAISLRGLRAPALASSAGEVASAMKLARQMAITSRRKAYVVFPITANVLLSNNIFRSYAIFEEIPPEEEATDVGVANNSTLPVHVARTEWRTLPDGVVFCNLAAAGYSTLNGDPFTGFVPGEFRARSTGASSGSGQEWLFFNSFGDFRVVVGSTTNRLNAVPFLGFFPSGRAFYNGADQYYAGAAIRLVSGIVQNESLLMLTDTNNYYYVETDPTVGRVRVRPRDSYR